MISRVTFSFTLFGTAHGKVILSLSFETIQCRLNIYCLCILTLAGYPLSIYRYFCWIPIYCLLLGLTKAEILVRFVGRNDEQYLMDFFLLKVPTLNLCNWPSISATIDLQDLIIDAVQVARFGSLLVNYLLISLKVWLVRIY